MKEEKNNVSVENNEAGTNVVGGQSVADNVAAIGDAAAQKVKEFSNKEIGGFKGKQILLVVGAVLVVLLLFIMLSNLGGEKEVKYPVVFKNSDGDILLMTGKMKDEEDAIKLSDESSGSVVYAHTTDRYVLFKKNDALYLYDSKDKEETTKLVSDIDDYMFTENDKYVIAVNTEGALYSYDFKKEKEKIASDVEYVVDYTDTHVLYLNNEDELYVRSLNPKKDDKQKVMEEYDYGAELSADSKNVVYTNEDGDLYIFNVKKGEDEKIASEVDDFYCDEKSCTKMYFLNEEGNLYYYNGKSEEKIASDVASISALDVENQQVLYTKSNDDDEYTLYYQKGKKDAVEVEDELESVKSARIYEGKAIYYINSDAELKYAKISGAKIGKVKTIAEDVEMSLRSYKKGYIFVADVNEKSNGDLYLAYNGKTKKIDSDVSDSYLTVSNSGDKVYYMKDYGSSSGDLYVTSGGKGKKIDSDVHAYNYVTDKVIYYIKDYSSSKGKGDLYRYTGKSLKIAEDVTRIASTPNYFTLNK